MAGPRTGSTLYAKLWAILTEIERLPKDKANTQGSGYKYLSESALKERFHPLFVKHGILLVPTRSSEPVTTPPSGTKSSYITTFTQSFAILDLVVGLLQALGQIKAGSAAAHNQRHQNVAVCVHLGVLVGTLYGVQ